MSYVFSTEKVGSVKLQNFHHSFGTNLTLAGIDGQTNDADTIICFTKTATPALTLSRMSPAMI